jgi:hypothetical protein
VLLDHEMKETFISATLGHMAGAAYRVWRQNPKASYLALILAGASLVIFLKEIDKLVMVYDFVARRLL